MTAIPRTRHRLARRLSWLVIASLASVALFAPGTMSVSAAEPVAIYNSIDNPDLAGNPTCAAFDVTYGGGQSWQEVKKDPAGNGVITVAGFGTITVTNFDNDGASKGFSWTSTFGIDAVLAKNGGGNGGYNVLYVYAATAGGTEATSGSLVTGSPTGISHISFCFDTSNPQPTDAPTNPPTDAPTNPPTEAPTNPPTEAPTNPPTQAPTEPPTGTQFSVPSFSIVCGGSITVTNFAAANVDDVLITPGDVVINADGTYPLVPGDYSAVGRVGGEVVTDPVPFTIEACPTDAPTGAPTEAPTEAPTDVPPTGGVGGATGAPGGATAGTTLPPTDSLGDPAKAPGSDAWRLVLLALAGTLAGALLLTPARSVRKDR